MTISGNETTMLSGGGGKITTGTSPSLWIKATMAMLLSSCAALIVQPPLMQVSRTARAPSPTALWYQSSREYEGDAVSTNSISEVATVQHPNVPRDASGSDSLVAATPSTATVNIYSLQDIWTKQAPTFIQGGSIRTWTFDSPMIDTVQVHLKTDGRPMNANVELWQGPDNTPQKMAIYVEDGKLRPVVCFLNTPFGRNSVSIRNTAKLEYPVQAIMEPSKLPSTEEVPNLAAKMNRLMETSPKLVQGGAVLTKPIPSHVKSVQILLQTPEGRPLCGRIELLNGPNNVRQVMEIYSEDGLLRPFYSIWQTPASGGGANVIRIINTATVEFPMTALVEPWEIEGDQKDVEKRPDENASLIQDSLLDSKPLLELGGTREWGPGFHNDSNGRGSM